MATVYLDAASAWGGVQRLVYQTVAKFYETYGGDLEEYESLASFFFMKAWNSYNPQSAAFTTWVRCVVWRGLRDALLRTPRNRYAHQNTDFAEVPSAAKDLGLLFLDLSEDAGIVLRLVLDSPMDVQLAVRQLGKDSPRNIRRAVLEFLNDVGWRPSRIRRAFREIGEALC